MKYAVLVALAAALLVPVAAMADDAATLDGAQVAWMPSSAPVLTSGGLEVLGAAEEGKKGGCLPALASCLVPGVPLGQYENSGNEIPLGRAMLGWIPLYNSYMSYKGETVEEFLGVDTLATGGEAEGGCSAAWKSCCLWMPSGDLLNSGEKIPTRSWLGLIPYVGFAVHAYNVYKAYDGETAEGFIGTEF